MGCDSDPFPTRYCKRPGCKRPALHQYGPLRVDNYDGLCREDWQQRLSELVQAAMTGKSPEELLRELVARQIMLRRRLDRLST